MHTPPNHSIQSPYFGAIHVRIPAQEPIAVLKQVIESIEAKGTIIKSTHFKTPNSPLLDDAFEAQYHTNLLPRQEQAMVASFEQTPPLGRCHFKFIPTQASNPFNLAPRTKEAALLLTQGFTNKDIAAEMNIALGTVKTHVRNIMVKTESHNRSQAGAKIRNSLE